MTYERLENLNGQVAVITGSNSGVGFSTASQLAKAGAKIVGIVRRNVEEMQVRLDTLGPGHRAMLADVTDSKQINEIASQLTQCDILVNNAGGYQKRIEHYNLNELTDELFDQVVKVNLYSTFYVTRAFMSLLKKSPYALVVNISSASSIRTGGSNIAYSAAKAGVDSMTRNLAKALAPIRLVSLNPSLMKSPNTTQPDALYTHMATQFPLKRIVISEDVASAVEALATTLRFVTGNNIVIDGGKIL